MHATAGSFCPRCLEFTRHEHEVRPAAPDVVWTRCGACGRLSVWRRGDLEYPPFAHGLATTRLPASVYFELAAAAETPATTTSVRVALRAEEAKLAFTATFLTRYLDYELEQEAAAMNESVLDRALRDQRETHERIESLRAQIAQEERHVADVEAFVATYRRYAGMADGAPFPR